MSQVDIHEDQHAFRKDAHTWTLFKTEAQRMNKMKLIQLDVENAFNSVPHQAFKNQLIK